MAHPISRNVSSDESLVSKLTLRHLSRYLAVWCDSCIGMLGGGWTSGCCRCLATSCQHPHRLMIASQITFVIIISSSSNCLLTMYNLNNHNARSQLISVYSYRTSLWHVAACGLRGCKRIDPLRFLAGCRKKRVNQALSVLSLSLGFLCVVLLTIELFLGCVIFLCYLCVLSLGCSP